MTREQFIREIGHQQEPLRRFLLVLCEGDAFTADDIAQDACVKAWIAVDGFRGAAKFSTWLFRIAWNCWCDRKYSSRAMPLDSGEARMQISDDVADGTFEYQALHQAIEGLKPDEKAAILLFYMEDRSIKEISAILGIPQGSVKSLLSRGRAKLRIKLKSTTHQLKTNGLVTLQ